MDVTHSAEADQFALQRVAHQRAGESARPMTRELDLPAIGLAIGSPLTAVRQGDRRSTQVPARACALWSRAPAEHLLIGTLSILAIAAAQGPGRLP